MYNSVGNAWAILKGHRTGDKAQAKKLLEGMSPSERQLTNRSEGRVNARLKADPLKIGRKPRKRWTLG